MKKRDKMCIVLDNGTEIHTNYFTLKTESKNLTIHELKDDAGFYLQFEDNMDITPVDCRSIIIDENPWTRTSDRPKPQINH